MSNFTESIIEQAALAWLEAQGYAVLHGPDIAAGERAAERSDPDYRDVVLEGRLRQALARLNPDLPPEQLPKSHDINFDIGWQGAPMSDEELKVVANRWRYQKR